MRQALKLLLLGCAPNLNEKVVHQLILGLQMTLMSFFHPLEEAGVSSAPTLLGVK